MSWIKLITLLISLALEVVRYLERRTLIRQVEAAQLQALLERANEIAKKAIEARNASRADTSDDSLLSDKNNRKNWPGNLDGDSNPDRSGDKKNSV
jgi:hypothetical protein